MNTCPYCGRDNIDDAAQCRECGIALADEESPNTTKPDASESASNRAALYGLLWLFGGLLATVITYFAAAPGGTYVVWWGAMLYGAIRIVRAVTNKQLTPEDVVKSEDLAYEAFNVAAELEARGSIREALIAYYSIVKTYPDTDASRDAIKSIESILAVYSNDPEIRETADMRGGRLR